MIRLRAAQSRPPSPSPSEPGCPPPLWPRGQPLLPGSPRQLKRLPAPLELVSRTHDAIACRFRAWRRRSCRNTCTGIPLLSLSAAVPGLSVIPSLLQLALHASVAWVVAGFCPLPTPVYPPPALMIPRWAPQRFRPPGATLPLWGCSCPAATHPPLCRSS